MSLIYLDCSMGAAGDMLTASLIGLFEDPFKITEELNEIGIPHTKYVLEKAKKCGIEGYRMKVLIDEHEEHEHLHFSHEGHDHSHHHNHGFHLHDIDHIVSHLNLSSKVKKDVLAIYRLIAEAESEVHGAPVDHIHFHEVGTLDAIADVCAVSYLLNRLSAEGIICSPIHVGSGTVHCAHGILPVPAPATALLLKGIPIYQRDIASELCTPTGAACLRYFVDSFEEMPVMEIEKIGIGCGNRDFKQANILRSFLAKNPGEESRITQLECTIDDMNGEEIGYALEKLLELGALDAYTIPVGMKKSRPGILLSVLCKDQNQDFMIRKIFEYTSTIGIRIIHPQRAVLKREFITRQTKFGPIRFKQSSGYGVVKNKAEYEDLKRIADENGLTIGKILYEIDIE